MAYPSSQTLVITFNRCSNQRPTVTMTDHSANANNLSSNNLSTSAANTNSSARIAIIGGGLSGLFTATLLERAIAQRPAQAHNEAEASNSVNAQHPQITIFEKSRSVGRLATRYRTDSLTNQNWQWAFGAQFFTAKSDSFAQFIAPWLQSGSLQPWCAQVVELTPTDGNAEPIISKKEQWDTTHARYISSPKMTSWGRQLADNLTNSSLKFKTRVAPLSKEHHQSTDQKTELFDEFGASLGCFDWVICTIPNGQAIELLADSGFGKQAQISQAKMLACYTLMLGWDKVSMLPQTLQNSIAATTTPIWDVAYSQQSILAKIFVEHQKPSHSELLPSVTIHANNDWSEAHVNDDLEIIQAQLLVAAKQALNWNNDTAPSQVDCHRWRYAATVINKGEEGLGVLVDNDRHWIVSGDWCGQGNIESCYLMAEQVVEVVVAALSL